MYQFPVKYYEENLLFNEKTNSCWACYKAVGFNYDYISVDRQISILNRLTRFIANLGIEAKILIIPTVQDISSHYSEVINGLKKNDPLYETAVIHARGTEEYLLEKVKYEGNNNYEVYIMTKLDKNSGLSSMLDELFRRPIKVLEEFFGVERREILLSEMKYFQNTAGAWYKEQNKRLSMVKTDEKTTQWLFRRIFRRGIAEAAKLRKNREGGYWRPHRDIVIKDGEKAVRPLKRDILTLTEGLVETENRHIKVTNSDGKISYQTFLTMSHIPDGLAFPGGEWLLLLQDYPFATEVCLHIKIIEFRDSMKKISGKKQEIKSQIEHVSQNDNVPDELYEASLSADELEAELKRNREPLADVSISFCIAADNEKEMVDNANFLKQQYEDMNFMIERPLTDQFKLFMEFIPGAGRYEHDYILPLPPQTIAGAMFAATRMLGDLQGPYIGTTGLINHNVFLNIAIACLRNRSASCAFLGTLGGGKSFNANLLVYLNVIYGGAALIFDPKGEREIWLENIPELANVMRITTLGTDDEDTGKLDPFIIYKDDMNAAGELAESIVCELFKLNPKDDEYIVLVEAIDWVKTCTKKCMISLVDRLDNLPEDDDLRDIAKKLARHMNGVRRGGMAKLLFGTGDEIGLSFDNRLNILQIQNLQMPSPTTEKKDYTKEEILSTVLMLPIASFAKRFAMSDRSIFKLVLFDESWALSATQMGIKMI